MTRKVWHGKERKRDDGSYGGWQEEAIAACGEDWEREIMGEV